LLKISANSHRRLKKRVSAIDSKPQAFFKLDSSGSAKVASFGSHKSAPFVKPAKPRQATIQTGNGHAFAMASEPDEAHFTKF
jgi:hypothetical protein